jgi:hypothetical protein
MNKQDDSKQIDEPKRPNNYYSVRTPRENISGAVVKEKEIIINDELEKIN